MLPVLGRGNGRSAGLYRRPSPTSAGHAPLKIHRVLKGGSPEADGALAARLPFAAIQLNTDP